MKDPIPFGTYLLLDRVDVGGMAEVFLARAPGGGTCAVKRLLPGLGDDPDFVAMFLEEARLTARLSHPGIVAVHDLGCAGGSYYIAMEYVPGADLGAVLSRLRARGQRMPVAVAAEVAREVALALDYVHRQVDRPGHLLGIVHRDVSPQNVLLSFAGGVKLIDFGIARAVPEDGGGEGTLTGKVSYMSPERARGLPGDRRSDIFALGAVLHEMLAGVRLFRGETGLEVLGQVRRAEVSPPSLGNPEVGEPLDRAVMRALAREPEARFAWASELAAALAPYCPPAGPAALAGFLARALPEELAREVQREGGGSGRPR
ncbi:MAG TPA: serine/threonine-protein kinase [Anaeromyxobacteraceae bacterium]|nr:serine/threonine-protein kinase [Anaeromyxobacteraceae bacterium]